MATQVVMGTQCECSFGAAPSVLMPLPASKTFGQNMPAATVMDNKPFANILPFGVCKSLANPMVASATAAALGVLTPMPCIPATVAPWVPGSPQVLLGGYPALNDTSKLMCMWAGVISIKTPVEVKVEIP